MPKSHLCWATLPLCREPSLNASLPWVHSIVVSCFLFSLPFFFNHFLSASSLAALWISVIVWLQSITSPHVRWTCAILATLPPITAWGQYKDYVPAPSQAAISQRWVCLSFLIHTNYKWPCFMLNETVNHLAHCCLFQLLSAPLHCLQVEIFFQVEILSSPAT